MAVNVETRSHEVHLQNLINSDSPMTKLDASGDRRIIFGGRILRAVGLDELPQIFNILRREMSLVGPRPSTVNEFQCYKAWQEERLDAMPGLTGYWQVNGKNKTTFSEMIDLDIYYARNLSLFLDVSILSKTVPAMLGQVLESRFRKLGPKVSGEAMSKNVS
jgi:lipopolysaccharide/colanic/teichoic acid biosynthesis glycosyltransferase